MILVTTLKFRAQWLKIVLGSYEKLDPTVPPASVIEAGSDEQREEGYKRIARPDAQKNPSLILKCFFNGTK